jgi:hypothetical protein
MVTIIISIAGVFIVIASYYFYRFFTDGDYR